MDFGKTRLVIAIEPFWVKISTEDWSMKRSSVTVLSLTHSGACMEGMENMPLNDVWPETEVRWAISVRAAALTSIKNFSSVALLSVIREFWSKFSLMRS